MPFSEPTDEEEILVNKMFEDGITEDEHDLFNALWSGGLSCTVALTEMRKRVKEVEDKLRSEGKEVPPREEYK